MAPKKSTRRRPRAPRKNTPSGPLRLWLAGLFLIGFVLAGLVLLGELRRWYLVPPEPPAATVPAPLAPPTASTPPLEDLQVELDSLLLRSGLSRRQLRWQEGPEAWLAEIAAPAPAPEILAGFVERLRRLPEVEVDPGEEGELRLLWQDRAWGDIHFRPRSRSTAVAPPSVRPRLAIIVDDLGRDLQLVRELLAIDLPLTFAILPGEPQATRSATLAHRGGREVMIHLPMEPQGYPAVNPGRDALFLAAPPEELRRRFRGYLEQVPHAVGGNNHMGSRFTEDAPGMAVVLEEMRAAGLFFVDSRTSGRSVALATAREAGVPAAGRDRFLDNVQDEAAIARELRGLVELAKRRGSAIGICHPYPQTLAALRREAAYLRGQKIELVPVSRLVGRD
jgi:polysaccharide deacetylase 2 family uncharacterized protein YibQ